MLALKPIIGAMYANDIPTAGKDNIGLPLAGKPIMDNNC